MEIALHKGGKTVLDKMKEWLYLSLLYWVVPEALSSGSSEVRGGIVNGQAVGRCVAGFCLPLKYSSLDPPRIVDEHNNTLPNNVNITTDIMDILMVRKLNIETICYIHSIIVNVDLNDTLYHILNL